MNTAVVTTEYASPVGTLLLGAIDDGVCALEFADGPSIIAERKARLSRTFGQPVVAGENKHLESMRRELDNYFAGKLTTFRTPLVYPGTEFQRKVWSELRRIPYGATCSYEDVARAVCTAKAVRAVGRANGQNRIAIAVPCHRVVNKGGKLGGYGGGLWRKEFLLKLEGAR